MPQRYRQRPYVPARDPLAAIPPSRHPFQFWSMIAVVLGGLGNVREEASLINALLTSDVVALIWGCTMAGGGGLVLLSAFWPDRITGLLIERIGLGATALSLAVYGVGVLYLVGTQATVAGAMALSLVTASLWRVVHVNRELKILRLWMARNYVR